MFELLSKAVVESKQKVNITTSQEENEKAREEERGAGLYISIISDALCIKKKKKKVALQIDGITGRPSSRCLIFLISRSSKETFKIFMTCS